MAIVLLLAGLMPACRLKNVLLSLLGSGWSVHRTARLHPVVLWRIERLLVGRNSRIGPANVFRDLTRVEIGEDAVVGQFNWVTAEARYAEQADPHLAGSLVLEQETALASRHYLDCAGGVRLARMGIIAGVRSTFLTHWADHRTWVLRAAPIHIGAFTLVSSGSTVTAGATIAENSVVAAGSVVPKSLTEPGRLFAGVPARAVADLGDSAHSRRSAPRFARPDAPADAGESTPSP